MWNEQKRGLKLALLGGLGYPAVEILWRGRSHWSMALAGSLTLPLLDRLARRRRGLRAAARGAALITGVELGFGLLFNLGLRLRVWDYSHCRGHLWGQICPWASLRWFGLCLGLLPLLRRGAKAR